jgi:hypothetical protein
MRRRKEIIAAEDADKLQASQDHVQPQRVSPPRFRLAEAPRCVDNSVDDTATCLELGVSVVPQ